MSGEQTTTTGGKTPVQGAPGGAPTASDASVGAAGGVGATLPFGGAGAPAPAPGGASAAPPPPPPAPEGPRRVRLADDGDEIPDNAELLELSQRALKSRLERYSRKQLKERFGVEDPSEIQERLQRLAQYEQQEEERRLAQMTETDRLREQLSRAEERRLTAERQLYEVRESQVVEREDARVMGIVGKFIKPKFQKRWIPDLASHIATLDEEELRDPDKVIEEWCRKQVEENPEIALGEALPPPPAPPKVQVPITTGAEVTKPLQTQPSGTATVKTAAPGKNNSMTPSEWVQYKRENGIQY